MTNSKTLRLLSTLTDNEWKGFKANLNKNHRSGKLVRKIFDYVRPKLKASNPSADFELPKVYKKIFKKAINAKGKKVFQNALSELYTCLCDFLLHESLKKESFERDMLLLRVFQDRKLKREALGLIRRSEERMTSENAKDIWYPLKMLQLKHISYFNNHEEKISAKEVTIQMAMDYLDQFYAMTKLVYSCEFESREKVLEEEHTIFLLEEVIDFLKTEKSSSYLLSHFYMLCLQLIRSPKDSYCEALFQFLKVNQSYLIKSDQLVGYAYINNFMIRQIRKGVEGYQEKLFELYKNGLENEIFIFKGFMDSMTFNNIISAACRMGAFNWAQDFIDSQKKFLLEDVREALVSLSKANIYFEQKKYQETILMLNDVKFHSIYYSLRSRAMILRAYYELEEEHYLILDFCKSFKAFLNNNNKLSQSFINNYAILIKYVRIFIREKRTLDKAEIINNLENENAQLFKVWLLKKAQELE